MKRVSSWSQAFSTVSNLGVHPLLRKNRRLSRELKRRLLLESLETRQLLAGDNTPPMASGGWVNLQQSAPYQISIQDLNYSDVDADPIVSLTVQTLPSLGALELYGFPVYPGQEMGASDILFGNFNYVPSTHVGESYSTSFSFSVSDGWQSSINSASLGFQVEVTPNSPPAITGSSHSLNSPQPARR